MFLIFTVIILIAAAIILFVRRQTHLPLLEDRSPKHLDRENLRPLFAPDDAELRAIAEEERLKAAAITEEEGHLLAGKKLASFEEFRQTWRESPDRINTIELLLSASQLESGEIFRDVVDEILHKRPEALSARETADLVESHFWLLPQNERTPGVTFTINRDVAALRAGSHTKSEEEASDARN
ncbi:MAG: hypothetical protein ABJB34_05530 [Acidobacteriota bacterium]